MRVLGIIPARAGSKGVKNKNIAHLAGKPLISYTIDAAQKSTLLSHCIVSTDSIQIADISRSFGADVPFIRPVELAQDDTPTMPVVEHALAAVNGLFDAVLILQPTSPFRLAEHIDEAIMALEKNHRADSVISVVQVGDHHPARMKTIKGKWLHDPPFAESFEGQRRQDLPELYLRNGAIYLTRTKVIREQRSFKGTYCLAYKMTEICSLNIDTEIDLMVAEAMMKHMRLGDNDF